MEAIGRTSTSPNLLRPGACIDRFVIKRKLGSGGMGVVYLAHDPELKRLVALKLMRAQGEMQEKRFLREARSLARLRHPNVVGVHDVGVSEGRAYIAMEYVQGTTLRAWIRAKPTWERRLSVLRLAAQGLVAAHEAGLVHRDFKPDNVIVGKDDEVRVVDFGLARTMDEVEPAVYGDSDSAPSNHMEQLSLTGSFSGTPGYMSPEQWGGETTNERSDQFAFCVTAYETLFGSKPFPGENVPAIYKALLKGQPPAPKVSTPTQQAVAAAIMRGLRPEQKKRHASMNSLLAAGFSPQKKSSRAGTLAVLLITLTLLGTVAVVRNAKPIATASTDPRVAILASSDLPAVQATADPQDPLGVTVHRLSNGLTVYISPNHDKPSIHTAVMFRTGTRYETQEQQGAAELLSTLSYNGTRRVGSVDWNTEKVVLAQLDVLYRQLPNADDATHDALLQQISELTAKASSLQTPEEYRQVMAEFGATNLEAFVDIDSMRFAAEIPSNRFETWATLEADRWQNRVTRQFLPAVRTTMERVRSQGNLDSRLEAQVWQGLLGVEPALSLTKLQALAAQPYVGAEAFAGSWLVPNNAAIMLTGDIDPVRALPMLERAWGTWSPKLLPARPTTQPQLPSKDLKTFSSGPRGVNLVYQVEEPLSTLNVLEHLLIHSFSFELIRDGRITSLIPAVSTRERQNVFSMIATAHQDRSLDETQEATLKVIETVANGEFTAADLEQAKLWAHVPQLSQVHQNSARTDLLGTAFSSGARWPLDRAPQKVTREQIIDLARKLVTPDLVIRVEPGAIETPEVELPSMKALVVDQARGGKWAQQMVAQEVSPVRPKFLGVGRDYELVDTGHGTLIATHNKRTDLFELRIMINVNRRAQPVISIALLAASESARGRELFAQLTRLGVRGDIQAGDEQTMVILTGPNAGFEQSIPIIYEFLREPIISEEEWQYATKRSQRFLADIYQWEPNIDKGLRGHALYGERGRSKIIPGVKGVEDYTRDQIVAALGVLTEASRDYTYFGPQTADAVATFLKSTDSQTSLVQSRGRPNQNKRPQIYLYEAGQLVPGVKVRIYMPLGVPTAEDIVVQEVFGDYAEAAGSRFLRDQVVSSSTSISIPTQADEDAIATIELAMGALEVPRILGMVVGHVLNDPIDDKLLHQARTKTDTNYRSGWDPAISVPSVVHNWHRLGLGLTQDPRLGRFNRIPSISTKDLEEVQGQLREASRCIVIYGDLSKLDRKALAVHGDVHIVSKSDLFRP